MLAPGVGEVQTAAEVTILDFTSLPGRVSRAESALVALAASVLKLGIVSFEALEAAAAGRFADKSLEAIASGRFLAGS